MSKTGLGILKLLQHLTCVYWVFGSLLASFICIPLPSIGVILLRLFHRSSEMFIVENTIYLLHHLVSFNRVDAVKPYKNIRLMINNSSFSVLSLYLVVCCKNAVMTTRSTKRAETF